LEIFGWWRILESWRLEMFEGLKTLGRSMGGDCAQPILGWNRWCTKHCCCVSNKKWDKVISNTW
jgi:hypothetical protein